MDNKNKMKRLIFIAFLLIGLMASCQHHMMHPIATSGGNPTTTYKTFYFTSSAEGWTYVPAGADDSGGWEESSLSFQTNVSGRNKTTSGGDNYMYWQGTWEDLGVSSGQTVTSVIMDYNWWCSVFSTGDYWNHGQAELRSSDGSTLIGTFSAQSSQGTGTTSSATESGSSVTVTSSYQASTTTIRLYIWDEMDNGNNSSAQVKLNWDNIYLEISNE